MLEGDAAGVVEHEAAPGAVEERLVELGLQAGERTGQGGLRQVQGPGGGAHGALSRNGVELPELLQLHEAPSFRIVRIVRIVRILRRYAQS